MIKEERRKYRNKRVHPPRYSRMTSHLAVQTRSHPAVLKTPRRRVDNRKVTTMATHLGARKPQVLKDLQAARKMVMASHLAAY
jgi:hypothetical protein